MSRENVEVVRRVCDAAARRDRGTVLALYDPDVELDLSRIPLAALTGQGIYRGHDGLRSMFRDWYEAFENYEEDCEELIVAGEQVISVLTGRGRGRASGTDVEMPFFIVWRIRDGRDRPAGLVSDAHGRPRGRRVRGVAMPHANVDLVRWICAAWERATIAPPVGAS